MSRLFAAFQFSDPDIKNGKVRLPVLSPIYASGKLARETERLMRKGGKKEREEKRTRKKERRGKKYNGGELRASPLA